MHGYGSTCMHARMHTCMCMYINICNSVIMTYTIYIYIYMNIYYIYYMNICNSAIMTYTKYVYMNIYLYYMNICNSAIMTVALMTRCLRVMYT